jgi:hypothetical protein
MTGFGANALNQQVNNPYQNLNPTTLRLNQGNGYSQYPSGFNSGLGTDIYTPSLGLNQNSQYGAYPGLTQNALYSNGMLTNPTQLSPYSGLNGVSTGIPNTLAGMAAYGNQPINPYSQASNPYNGVSGLMSMLGLGSGFMQQPQQVLPQFTRQQSFFTPLPSPAELAQAQAPAPQPSSAMMTMLMSILSSLMAKNNTPAPASAAATTPTPSESSGSSGSSGASSSSGQSSSSSGSSSSAESSSSGASSSSGSSASSAPTSAAPSSGSSSSTSSAGKVTLFGGSQSGENNIDFANNTDKDMLVYCQKNLDAGEQDPGGSVFKIPAHSKMTISAPDNKGLRFQKYGDALPSDKQAELDKNGTVSGVTAPAKTGTLYESNYDPSKHLSWDDISPLDGANIPMSMSGTGGRTVHFTQQIIDGAPGKNADGTIPGLGPDVTSAGNDAANPALRDYYAKTSLSADGTRAFYFNSSAGGEADKANVSYTGSAGKVRTTVELG